MEANTQPSSSSDFTTMGQAKEPLLMGDEECYMAPHSRDPGGAMGWTQVPIGVMNSSPTSFNLKLPAPVPSTSKTNSFQENILMRCIPCSKTFQKNLQSTLTRSQIFEIFLHKL